MPNFFSTTKEHLMAETMPFPDTTVPPVELERQPLPTSDLVAKEGERSRRVVEVVAVGMLAGMLLSPKLWLSSRSYPLTPVVDSWPVVVAPYDEYWYLALLVLLVAIPLTPWQRLVVLVFVVLSGVLCLGDQTRWQPWVYQYLMMFIALALGPGQKTPHSQPLSPRVQGERRGNAETPKESSSKDKVKVVGRGLNACRFIVASIYFWSGLQKLNYSFQDDVYPWLIEPFQTYLPASVWSQLQEASLAPPIIEAAIGLGLLIPILRPLAILFALGMHAAILCSIGPLGHNWNTVVWPWNLAMIFLVVRLFGGSRRVPFLAVVWPGRSVVHGAILLLFGIMPLFNFWGLWDSYLSAALYSGNTLEAVIVLPKEVYKELPLSIRTHVGFSGEEGHEVNLDNWANEELNVPSYPARRVYHHIAKSLGLHASVPTTVIINFREPPDIFTGKRETTKEVIAVK